MRDFYLFISALLLTACGPVSSGSSDSLFSDGQPGDLLFCVETESDGLGGAIAAVTEGKDQVGISHVAILADHQRVVEAAPDGGVRVVGLQEFLDEAHHDANGLPMVLAARLRDTTGVAASVCRALGYVGLPYDTLYLPDNSAIYCSELVQLSYQRNDGTPIFAQQPMTFRDSTGQISPFWSELYQAHGMEVPEGLPGTNPGGISRDQAIYFIH